MFPTSLQSENSQWDYLKILLLSKTITKRTPATRRNRSKLYLYEYHMGLPWWSVERIRLQTMQEMQVQSLGREDILEEDMTSHSSVLAWKVHGQRILVG